MRKHNGTQGFEYQPRSEKWIRKRERESDEKLVQYRKLSMQICNKNNPHCGGRAVSALCGRRTRRLCRFRSGRACICSRCSTACFCAGHFTGIFRSAPGPPEQFPFQKPSRTSSVPLPFPQKAGQRFEMPAGRRLCWSRRRPPSPRRSFPSAPLAAI